MVKGIWSYASVIGTFFGIISATLLAKQALELGFAAPLQTAFDWYDNVVRALLSPLAPYLEGLVAWIKQHLDKDIALNPHWRHFLVLGSVLFGASLRAGRNVEFGTIGICLFVVCAGYMVRPDAKSIAVFAIAVASAVAYAFFRIVVDFVGRQIRGRTIARSRLQIINDEPWRLAEALALLRSITLVFGGVLLFVGLNAGLKLAGM